MSENDAPDPARDEEGGPARVDPRALSLRSPREEFLSLAAARLERLEADGESEQAALVAEARDLGAGWLPDSPGGGSGES